MRISGLVMAIGDVYGLMIIIRVFLSWVPSLPRSLDFLQPAVDFINKTTDWVLVPTRRLVPPIGMFDFSPVVAYIIVITVRSWLSSLLWSLGL